MPADCVAVHVTVSAVTVSTEQWKYNKVLQMSPTGI